MADRINADGYYLTLDGRPDETRSADHARWQKTIHDAWVKGHGNEPMPTDYTIMVVEKGDCQWTIAEDAGADPVKTAYTINEQFSNPDLILPDQVVFLPPSTHYSVTEPAKYGQTGPAHDNADIFADQTSTHVTKAWPGGDITPVKTDVHTYMDSVMALPDTPLPPDSEGNTDSERTRALQNLLAKPSWGLSGDKGIQGRHLVLVDYFSRPGMNTPQNVKDLEVKLGLASYNEHGEFIEKTADQFKKEILANPPADVMVNGKVDDGKVNIMVQQKVDLQNDIKATAQELGIK
jgi:hypothetical protein